MGSHMGVMEAVEARGGVTPEVITFIPNKRPTTAAGIVKEIIIAPIAVIIWAVIAVVITVVVHWTIYAGTSSHGEQRVSAQDHFEILVHDKPLVCYRRKLRTAAIFGGTWFNHQAGSAEPSVMSPLRCT
jgi:hypothetical protein